MLCSRGKVGLRLSYTDAHNTCSLRWKHDLSDFTITCGGREFKVSGYRKLPRTMTY